MALYLNHYADLVHSSAMKNVKRRDITVAHTKNGRTVKVVEKLHRNAFDEFLLYEVEVSGPKGNFDVFGSSKHLTEALQAHFILVSKYGGLISPDVLESKKTQALDEVISELSDESKVKNDKSFKDSDQYREHQSWVDINANPYQTRYRLSSLNWRTSVVDALKAIGKDISDTQRQALALRLGYRKAPWDNIAINNWLLGKILQKFGPTLEKLESFEKAATKKK